MLRKDFVIGVVAVGVALAVASLVLGPSAVQADEHSAMRSFSETLVAPGGEIEVTVVVADYGAIGQVAETLPEGFGYVSTSLEGQDAVSGQTVTFTLLGDDSFTYTVTAAAVAGTYSFEGVVKDTDQDERMVGGDSTITVEGGTVEGGAARTFSTDEVLLDGGDAGEVVVTIDAEYGMFGQVVEVVPDGFGYVSSSLPDDGVTVEGQTVTFIVLGESNFTYTVIAASTAGTYSFSGVLTDENRMEHAIEGDSSIAVVAMVAVVAVRDADDLRDTLLPPTGGPSIPSVMLLALLLGSIGLVAAGWVLSGRRSDA